jgi:lipoprotein signal peptidase
MSGDLHACGSVDPASSRAPGVPGRRGTVTRCAGLVRAILVAGATIALDLVTKIWAQRSFSDISGRQAHDSPSPSVFIALHDHHAFTLGNSIDIVIPGVILGVLIGVLFLLISPGVSSGIGMGLVLGGAISNTYEMAAFRHATDFIGFHIFDVAGTLNFADLAIGLGFIVLLACCIGIFRSEQVVEPPHPG